ncbi:DUF1622 domain-containing protein [Streptomyces sp. A10(2020)]|jgi:uncharacterized membrane protein|uniref:DUF1622 domain-containing protein n=3 Tax=Streptomyces TaxID=1883 RepID=A0A126Y1J7_9ACTN|nr:putative membrane protein [Streptomyces albidoflavus]AWL35798.1 DUF1622 domain-containing protein [Streptomyces sp. SM17]KDR64077.1 membrane protein [Streptomyces wadayamensis]MBK3382112.1 DUF1622 domain-containing protein [Streptomyces sp. DEF147AK]MBK3386979.1 DUF1622 domain-containing protein [Streptomyces sp. DEF1AK]MBT2881643.1 DUF1622 domain-containing protein [Streptomyces sp. McG6]MBT2888337.1 DUF1622 domain-containing protein [Streptomyces sp. McG5]MBT2894469.1 DUF1622 domain-con
MSGMDWDLLPESALHRAVDLTVRLVEFGGAAVIFIGAVWAFVQFLLLGVRRRRPRNARPIAGFNRIRLSLGRFLALGLEFQLAGDVLRTAIAPSFDQIGQLAAIAAIRTGLNFFLGREIEAERREVERLSAHDRGGATAPAP